MFQPVRLIRVKMSNLLDLFTSPFMATHCLVFLFTDFVAYIGQVFPTLIRNVTPLLLVIFIFCELIGLLNHEILPSAEVFLDIFSEFVFDWWTCGLPYLPVDSNTGFFNYVVVSHVYCFALLI